MWRVQLDIPETNDRKARPDSIDKYSWIRRLLSLCVGFSIKQWNFRSPIYGEAKVMINIPIQEEVRKGMVVMQGVVDLTGKARADGIIGWTNVSCRGQIATQDRLMRTGSKGVWPNTRG